MIKKIIILLGLPGSGKGTQGHILAEELMIPHISTGDIFRKMASIDSEEAKILNGYMDEGKLLPASLANKVVRKFILSNECKDGCILDGYPRNLDQAEYFIENIESEIKVIFFNSDDQVVIKRILGRFSCALCGRLYNKYFDNPKTKSICDSCGSKNFISRADDDEKTILSRITEYRKETIPLIEYYKRKGKFFTVNADKSKEEITKEVFSIVKKI